jgi:hypothetical protein
LENGGRHIPAGLSLKRQKVFDLVREMAGLALSVEHPALMLGFSVMATETVVERSRPKIRPLRIIGMPRLAVGRNVSAWNDDRISLNRLVMHHTGVTRRTSFSVAPNPKGLHVFPMAHDKPDVFDRRRQVTGRNLGDTQDVPVTTEADIGIDTGSQIVRIRRGPEQIDGYILGSGPGLVMDPSFDTGPDMAGDARHFFMRRFDPALI